MDNIDLILVMRQLLTIFEISTHPKRNLPAIDSALQRLDGIIRTLGMTSLDADETDTRRPSPQHPNHHNHNHHNASHVLPLPLYNRLPISQSPQAHLAQPATSQLLQYHAPSASAAAAHAQLQARMQLQSSGPDEAPPACPCAALSLVRNWPEARTVTPFWLCTPAWSTHWSAAEVRREECRRLCWNTLLLIAGYTTYRASMGLSILDLSIVQPSNVSHFPPLRCEILRTEFWSIVQECFPGGEPYRPPRVS